MSQIVVDVAVIGAGVAGLGAARALREAGRSVVLFDKGRLPGGRVCSRFQDGCRFDHGAQNIKAQGTELGRLMERELAPETRLTIDAPVDLHLNGKVVPGDPHSNSEPKYSYRDGLAALPRELARGLNLWLSTRVARLEEETDGFTLRGDDGNVLTQARRVILTAPGAQSADLLAQSALREDAAPRIEALRSVPYSRCLTLLLRYDVRLDSAWYALLAQDRAHPLLWLANENHKAGVCEPNRTALVAQLGPESSLELWDAPEAEVASRTASWVGEILGPEFGRPSWSSLKKWRFSQSKDPANWDVVNPFDSRIGVCGDALTRSRVPDAYESGLRAARHILEAV